MSESRYMAGGSYSGGTNAILEQVHLPMIGGSQSGGSSPYTVPGLDELTSQDIVTGAPGISHPALNDLLFETDFSEYDTLAFPEGWLAKAQNPSGWSIEEDASAIGGQILTYTHSTAGCASISPEHLSLSDADITMKCASSWGEGFNRRHVGIITRDTASTGVRGYLIDISNEGGVQGFHLRFLASAATATISEDPLASVTISPAFGNGDALWIRFRVTADRFRGKFWADGATEPSSWHIDHEDNSSDDAGLVGIVLLQSSTAHEPEIDYIAIRNVRVYELVTQDIVTGAPVISQPSKRTMSGGSRSGGTNAILEQVHLPTYGGSQSGDTGSDVHVIDYLGTDNSGFSSSLILSRPANVDEGTLLVAFGGGRIGNDGSPGDVSAPAGWTVLGRIQSGAGGGHAYSFVAWKLATTDEPASYTFTFADAGLRGTGGILVVRNHNFTGGGAFYHSYTTATGGLQSPQIVAPGLSGLPHNSLTLFLASNANRANVSIANPVDHKDAWWYSNGSDGDIRGATRGSYRHAVTGNTGDVVAEVGNVESSWTTWHIGIAQITVGEIFGQSIVTAPVQIQQPSLTEVGLSERFMYGGSRSGGTNAVLQQVRLPMTGGSMSGGTTGAETFQFNPQPIVTGAPVISAPELGEGETTHKWMFGGSRSGGTNAILQQVKLPTYGGSQSGGGRTATLTEVELDMYGGSMSGGSMVVSIDTPFAQNIIPPPVVITQPAISQTHELIADDIEAHPEISAPDIGYWFSIDAQDLVLGQVVIGIPGMGTVHHIEVPELVSAPVIIDGATVGQAHGLIVQNIVAGAPVIRRALVDFEGVWTWARIGPITVMTETGGTR